LKAQGEIATFHFPDNLARGLKYEAVVLIDLIQKVYDTKRVVRVLGLDGNMEHAVLDPNHPEAYGEQQTTADDIQKIFNPSLGQYDVVIDTGPSFQTQRQEGYASMMELASRNPALMQIAGDIIMRNADYPGADKIADRLAKALPPQLQEQKGGTEQQLAQVSQQAMQMQQQMQMMSQQLQETQAALQQAESGAQKTQLEMQYKMQLAEFDAQLEEQKQIRALESQVRIEQYRAELERQRQDKDREAKLMQAQLDAQVKVETSQPDNSMECAKLAMDKERLEFDRQKAQLESETAILLKQMDMKMTESVTATGEAPQDQANDNAGNQALAVALQGFQVALEQMSKPKKRTLVTNGDGSKTIIEE
jgi:chromosome segregation ATPase